MAYEIVRKKRFLNKLTYLLEYLEHEWGDKVAFDFLNNIDNKVDTQKVHPYIGALTGIRNTRSIHITKHNRLFYKIVGNKVIIINLYNTSKRTYRPPV